MVAVASSAQLSATSCQLPASSWPATLVHHGQDNGLLQLQLPAPCSGNFVSLCGSSGRLQAARVSAWSSVLWPSIKVVAQLQGHALHRAHSADAIVNNNKNDTGYQEWYKCQKCDIGCSCTLHKFHLVPTFLNQLIKQLIIEIYLDFQLVILWISVFINSHKRCSVQQMYCGEIFRFYRHGLMGLRTLCYQK